MSLLSKNLIEDSVRRFERQHVEKAKDEVAVDGARERHIGAGKRRHILDKLTDVIDDPQIATRAFERILAGNDLVGVNYLAIGARVASAVGRVRMRDRAGRTVGYGTGFLIAPGVMMTNNHVLGSDLAAAQALIEFDYELDIDGQDRPVVAFALDPAHGFVTDRALDFTVVGVAARALAGDAAIADFGWLPLRPRPGKSFEGEYLTIIQHPGGERKQVCVRENKLIRYAADTLWYQTDTVGGSSGSPVFNGFWEVVALHHSGVPETDAKGNWLTVDGTPWTAGMDETQLKWKANEGIRISRIVEHLRLNHADLDMVRLVLTAPDATARSSGAERVPAPAPVAPGQTLAPDGTLTVTLPLTVSLKLDLPAGLAMPPAPPVPGSDMPPPDPALIEKVEVDQTTYDARGGYDPAFLGKGALAVPLPGLTAARARDAAKLKAGGTELKYHHYSVVMNRKRRLAYFTAANIDGTLRRSSGKREGDRWYVDPRLPESAQLTDSFYAAVKLQEARARVFDRGHLVRRLDTTWGTTEAEAKRNGDDTFHWTNCAPQHYSFNQGSKLWAGIEDYVLNEAEDRDMRISVFTGPVFRRDDETREGVQIPRQFFKVAAFAKGGRLVSAGFLLSQASLLDRDLPAAEELRPLKDDEAALFQVRVAKIASLTGLRINKLRDADAAMGAFEAARQAAPLYSLDDMRL